MMTETKLKPPDLRQPIESDLILAVRKVVQSLGRQSAHRADRIDAEIMAERIVQALRGLNYIILQKPPRPIAPASSLPRMGKGMWPDADPEPLRSLRPAGSTVEMGGKDPNRQPQLAGPKMTPMGLGPTGQVRLLQSSRASPVDRLIKKHGPNMVVEFALVNVRCTVCGGAGARAVMLRLCDLDCSRQRG